MSVPSGYHEAQALSIIKEFNKVFKCKLSELTDRVDLKLDSHIQEWINDLTEQNEMLVGVVSELENEAALRVTLLEDKLRSTSFSCDKLMQKYKDTVPINFVNDTCQNLVSLRNDVYNLFEVIRRAREQNEWSIDGLKFYTIDPGLLLQDAERAPEKLSESLCQIHNSCIEPLREELSLQLNLKDEELQRMKKSMLDIQDSLLVKVSEKYEENLVLRRDVQNLERQMREMIQEMKNKNSLIERLKMVKEDDSLEKVMHQLEMKDQVIKRLHDEMQRLSEEGEKKNEYKRKFEELQNGLRNCNEFVGTTERMEEREKHNQEVANLNQTIFELEKRLTHSPFKQEDSQQAQLQEAQFTISQQQLTISNLRDALTVCKSELDELQRKSVNNFQACAQLEQKSLIYFRKIQQLNLLIDYLQDVNLNLEMNIFEYIQDVAILEMRLFKYQLIKFPDNPTMKLTAEDNKEYLKEIEDLQCSYARLQQEYGKAVKCVDVLQTELDDYQNSSENICGESRNVIDNVRHWLEHQSLINHQITQKFNNDQLLIHNLKQKVT